MRDIKFRAWDKRSLKWFDMSTFSIMPDGIQVNVPGLGPVFVREDYDLMQYTGLIDVNHREVYEGDILKVTNPHTGTSAIKRVWWNGETARFNGIPTSLVNVYEVIGNIYENPELLEQTNG